MPFIKPPDYLQLLIRTVDFSVIRMASHTEQLEKKPEEIEAEREEELEFHITELIAEPPDGGWGWMIVLSSFANHFILDGICYAFGAFLPIYVETFNSSAATTGALMSTLIGCYLLSGKKGCKSIQISVCLHFKNGTV